jgi:Phosphodiester glycosidase
MAAFGAVRGMALDGGGSSEIVARLPGDVDARLLNQPSDGHERKVADGIFVYSSAPIGPPSQLLAQPQIVRALPGATVGVRFAAADDSERVVDGSTPIETRVEPETLGTYRDGVFTALHPGDGEIVARAGDLVLHLPVHVLADPAHVVIFPREPSVAQGGSITLRARAYDTQGYPVALPATLPWRATNATIDQDGTLIASNSDALVSLLLGEHLADARVTVGFHDVPLVMQPSFMSVPHGGEGSVGPSPTCPTCTQLRYSLGPLERGAYLMTAVTLPDRTVAVAFDAFSDGHGERLKVALRNAIDEEVLLPAATMDQPGWQHVEVRLPESVAQPARLVAIYVIGTHPAQTLAGAVDIKGLHAIAAGTGPERP